MTDPKMPRFHSLPKQLHIDELIKQLGVIYLEHGNLPIIVQVAAPKWNNDGALVQIKVTDRSRVPHRVFKTVELIGDGD